MYEFKNGSARLVYALDRRKDDPESISALAKDLYYIPEQLIQDIQALVDYYEQAERNEKNQH